MRFANWGARDMLTKFLMSRDMRNYSQSLCIFALCAVCSAGLGIIFAASAGNHYFLLMRKAASCFVTIVGSAVTVLLPFLVSVFVITHSKLWLAYCICGSYIFSLSSTCYAICRSFGTAGWLIQGMMQFPDICLTPVLICLFLLRIKGKCNRESCICCIIFAIVIGMIDYCLISPFLANLIDSYETMGRYAIHVGLDWRL